MPPAGRPRARNVRGLIEVLAGRGDAFAARTDSLPVMARIFADARLRRSTRSTRRSRRVALTLPTHSQADPPTDPNANCCDRLLEGVDERDLAGGADHRRRRVDLDHRQPPASLGNLVPSRVCAFPDTLRVYLLRQVSRSTIGGDAVMLVSFDACQVTSDADRGPTFRSTRSGRDGQTSRALPARSLTAGEPGPLGLVLGQRDRLAVGLTCFVVPAEPA